MTSFGRKPTTKVAIPNNRLLYKRANRQLEGYAAVKAEHFENSLGVDAPLFYFWHSNPGSIPCSCVTDRNSANSDIEVGGENKKQVVRKSKDDFNIQIPEYGEKTLTNTYGQPLTQSKSPNSRDKFFTNDYDDPFSDHDDASNDVEDVIPDNQSITGFNDPLHMFSDKTIYCPVCYGAGFIDSWNVHGGKRYAFDTSNAYNFDSIGFDISSKTFPTRLTSIKINAACYWMFTLPLVWNDILRISVNNGNKLVAPHLYYWTFKDSNGVIKELTANNLEEYNNTGEVITLSLTFNETDIEFTHAEIIFAFQEARLAQIPEVQQGYEQEFLDWNVNITAELPPDLAISEGDYLTESKYQKIWKVSALTKRVTAGGVVFGLTAELRALHSFESNFSSMSIFSTDYYTGKRP